MNEIEIKARVSSPETLIQTLNKKAVYTQSVTRHDYYWGKSISDKTKIRLRYETSDNSSQCLVTYKKKETHKGSTTQIEVNQELETTIKDPKVLEAFLKDTGFIITLEKTKQVMDWTLKINDIKSLPDLEATFELCNVEKLGYFLEIEIISPSDNEDDITAIHKKLEELLEFAGLSKENIENRYYSELLRELENKN